MGNSAGVASNDQSRPFKHISEECSSLSSCSDWDTPLSDLLSSAAAVSGRWASLVLMHVVRC